LPTVYDHDEELRKLRKVTKRILQMMAKYKQITFLIYRGNSNRSKIKKFQRIDAATRKTLVSKFTFILGTKH